MSETPSPDRLLDDPTEIATAIGHFRACAEVALDLEAAGMFRYRDTVSLVQLAGGGRCELIDPLPDPGALAPLGPLVEDAGVLKILHGGDYDVRLMKRDFGFRPARLFDTMIAAQLTGRKQVGLAALLEAECGVKLDKKHQRDDWSRRPLTASMMRYAALDVVHLFELRDRLAADLERLDRGAWAAEEFALLAAVEPAPAKPPWCLDVKGAVKLSPRVLARLQALLEVRDEAARQWDRPPFKVLSNAVLLAWAEEPPRSRNAVCNSRGASGGILNRLAPEVLAALERAEKLPRDECPRPPERAPRARPAPEILELLSGLKKARARAAERLELEPGLLVNTATLEQLAQVPRGQVREELKSALKGWQYEAIGGTLYEAWNGG